MSVLQARLLQALKRAVSPRGGDLKQLTLRERGRELTAWCPDDETFTLLRELVLDRVYEQPGVDLRTSLGTVVDAGAHVGLFSLLASQWSDQVVSLEANAVNYSILRLNLARNALDNVDARHCALWRERSDALPFTTAHHSGGGTVMQSPEDGQATLTNVAAISLDDLISELGNIDVLKIDIEGAEYAALGACNSLDRISAIVGEMHVESEQDREHLGALVDKLREAGFSVALVSESELLSSGHLKRLWHNRNAVQGRLLVKALAAAYYLAPVQKPIKPRDATYELPILVAHR